MFKKMANKIVQPGNVYILFIFLGFCHIKSVMSSETIHYLEPGIVIENNKPGLQIFCHNAKSKYLMRMWESLTMQLSTNLDNYDLFDGKSPKEVVEKHNENQRSWRFNIFDTKKAKELKINPFEDICIGVYMYPSNQNKYIMSMLHTGLDLWKLTAMVLGIVVFWSAQRLSNNSVFYYLCGIILGVAVSSIILIYFFSKLLPKSYLTYVTIATCYTMILYVAQAIWENAQLILMQYREWVMWYIFTTSFMSFVICYRFGGVTNDRTKKLIQWFLQFAGLTTMYYSSYFREASFSCCICLIFLYNFPIVAIRRGRNYLKSMFPERRKLLTEDQYRLETIKETNKALKELRDYCSSPECSPWKTVLKLKDPIKFAKFVNGESHLSDEESREYDLTITRIADDSDFTEEDDF